MTIMPWYDFPQIGDLFRSITNDKLDQVDINIILQTVANKVRDPYLIESLNELIYNWRNLQDSTIQ